MISAGFDKAGNTAFLYDTIYKKKFQLHQKEMAQAQGRILYFLKALFAGTQMTGFCFLERTRIISAISAFMRMIVFSVLCDVNSSCFPCVMGTVVVCFCCGSQPIKRDGRRNSRREADRKHQKQGKQDTFFAVHRRPPFISVRYQ